MPGKRMTVSKEVVKDRPADGARGKILWNLAGLSFPLLVAALAVPRLLANIGAERFGLLSLAWGLIGYATTMDLGIGRATTQQLAALRGGRLAGAAANIIATATRLTTITGGIGMLLIAAAALVGLHRYLRVDAVPETELRLSLLLLAVALPLQAVSATYRGINEACLNFKAINLLRMLLGAANFGAPYLLSHYTSGLHWLVATLVLSRAIALGFYRGLALSCMTREGMPNKGSYRAEDARRLLHFGGWFSVSSVLSPLLVQADRFLIGVLLSATAVSTYVLPYEVAVQSLILSGAVTTVAFPLISGLLAHDPIAAQRVFRRWLTRLALLMLVAETALVLLMPQLLRLWLGAHLAPESVRVGQVLCLGVFFNSIGAMYFSLLHARRKTRQTALLHLTELPLFIAALYFLTLEYGVIGAAVAWVLRVAVDALALFLLARASVRTAAASADISYPGASERREQSPAAIAD
jgi:O-antigen/teichoic acid export membrane protein